MKELSGYRRADGEVGSRNHVLVLPSVVCATLVAREIADASGSVTVSHQHGCGHIGPDVELTRRLFAGLAVHPNVARVMIASLGCETVQGRLIATEVEELGHPANLLGIQEAGGASAAVSAGVAVAEDLVADAARTERTPTAAEDLVVGIAISRIDPRLEELIGYAVGAGARVVFAESPDVEGDQVKDAPELNVGARQVTQIARVGDAGAGAQLLATVAAAGAQVIVEFPSPAQPPQGFAVVPVLSVAAPDGLHTLIQEEFDVGPDAGGGEIWERLLGVFSGSETKAELRRSSTFAIPRLLRTM